eukprot:scaffold17139_cov123-Isochrysis_galbana.AAC.9
MRKVSKLSRIASPPTHSPLNANNKKYSIVLLKARADRGHGCPRLHRELRSIGLCRRARASICGGRVTRRAAGQVRHVVERPLV